MKPSSPLPPATVDILSDDDIISAFSPSPLRPCKRSNTTSAASAAAATPTFLVIDDDPTPQKPKPNLDTDLTPSFVTETPLSNVSLVKCSVGRSCGSGTDNPAPSLPNKFAGITSYICLESDNESADGSLGGNLERRVCGPDNSGLREGSEMNSGLLRSPSPPFIGSAYDRGFCSSVKHGASTMKKNNIEVTARYTTTDSFDGCTGTTTSIRTSGCVSDDNAHMEDAVPQVRSYNDKEDGMFGQATKKRKGRCTSSDSDKNNQKNEASARKKQLRQEKAFMLEERKRKKQEEKLQREALKAEAAKQKKLEKEKQKWEKGKFAIKSIVAEVDAKVVENGSVGGHLLTRFAEKGLSFRITSNPIEKSILWKMSVPDQISQLSTIGSEVPYVSLVYQAEEFCELVNSDALTNHVQRVRSHYPSFTVCYVTNKLMSYINKCEQNQYKKAASASSWRRPPVEEALSKLTTHFTKVHSRQCIDEAELAEHIVGLTSSLASCQFRKKLTHLSVHANGLIVPKDFIDRNLIKKNVWLKALVAIPKVQPRYAMSIWKRYPTMRSLLNVYMDPNKSVHEKEFLLKDLMVEGLLGKEDRRLGEMCSKRVYRILMAQSGGIKTDDVEDGADLFAS